MSPTNTHTNIWKQADLCCDPLAVFKRIKNHVVYDLYCSGRSEDSHLKSFRLLKYKHHCHSVIDVFFPTKYEILLVSGEPSIFQHA